MSLLENWRLKKSNNLSKYFNVSENVTDTFSPADKIKSHA